jgi:phosphatidylglycerol:prolipoprotein diacylglycerol transferase
MIDLASMTAALLGESMLHTLGPMALRLGGGYGVRWYGISYAAGFVMAWLILRWMSRTHRTPLTEAQVGDFLTWLIGGVLVGGRVGHVLFYDPHLLWTFTGEFPFWGLLFIHKGGMSSHGGILGVLLVCWLFARRNAVPAGHPMDLACFAACPGLGLGRLANWVNGELWGKPLPEGMQASPPWWSVKYPEQMLQPGFGHNAELSAIAAEVAPTSEAVMRGLQVAPIPVREGVQHGVPADVLYAACYGGDAAVQAKVAPLLTAFWPNNFAQALTDGVVLFAALALVWWKPRKPGVITGCFFAFYGLLRMGTEQLREPDAGVFRMGSLTLPMLLSLGMVLGGAAGAWWCGRRNLARLGGWVR